MGDYWTNAVRHPEDTGIGYLRRTINWDTPGFGSAPGVPIGALEAGAIPGLVNTYVEVAFNGTTPAITVGTAAAPASLAASATIVPGAIGAVLNNAPIAVGSGGLNGVPLAVMTIIYVRMTMTNTTAGKITVWLPFAVKREIEGVPFPAN